MYILVETLKAKLTDSFNFQSVNVFSNLIINLVFDFSMYFVWTSSEMKTF